MDETTIVPEKHHSQLAGLITAKRVFPPTSPAGDVPGAQKPKLKKRAELIAEPSCKIEIS